MAIAAQQQDARTQGGHENAANYPDPLSTFIWNAIMDRATDVHLHSVENGVRILHRVDGTVHPKHLLPLAEGKRLLNQIKSAACLNITRTFMPLEGEINWADEDQTWDIRVTLTPVRERESAHLAYFVDDGLCTGNIQPALGQHEIELRVDVPK